jgi:hypothetical protein
MSRPLKRWCVDTSLRRKRAKWRPIHSENRSSYGGRRMAQAPQQGYPIGRHSARSLTREAQSVAARRRTHRYRKAQGEALVVPTLLERRFVAGGAINRVRQAMSEAWPPQCDGADDQARRRST